MDGPGSAPVSLRISVTDRCQLRCPYCMPPEGVPLVDRAQVLRFEEMLAVVRAVRERFSLAKVHLTGGEPLIRRGLADFVARLAAEGPPDLALTTNGHRLAALAADLARAGLRRVNVSLDSLDAQVYAALTRGGMLAAALGGIDAALAAGLAPVKLNMVVLRGVNDGEVVRVARWGLARGCEVRFLELMPIGTAAGRFGREFVSSAEVRARLAGAFDLAPLPPVPGASSRNFRARDADGRTGVLGLISPCTAPFCEGCRRLRLTARGRLLGCLAQAEGIDLAPLLRAPGGPDAAALGEAAEQALGLKRAARRFADQGPMVAIGG